MREARLSDWRIGVDVGGSFTDLVAFNTKSKETRIEKVPTVKANPAIGVMDALAKLERDWGVSGRDVEAFLHGTTIGTNALLEMKGARVGLLVTGGFRAIPQVQTGSQPKRRRHSRRARRNYRSTRCARKVSKPSNSGARKPS